MVLTKSEMTQQIKSTYYLHSLLSSLDSLPPVTIDYLISDFRESAMLLLKELLPLPFPNSYFNSIAQKHRIGAYVVVDGKRHLVGICFGYFITDRSLNFESNLTDRNYFARLFAPENYGYVSTIGVIQEYRKMGVSMSLLNRLIKSFYSDRDVVGIYLHVLASNEAAYNLYTKRGFVKAFEKKQYYVIEGIEHDAFVMQLKQTDEKEDKQEE